MSPFKFLPSKTSKKHLIIVLITSFYITGRAAYIICVTKINTCNSDRSSRCSLMDPLFLPGPGCNWESRSNSSTTTNPCSTYLSTAGLWFQAKHQKKEDPVLTTRRVMQNYAGIMLWDKNSNRLPLYIQRKITKYLPLKIKDICGRSELKEKAKETGFSYKVP